MSIAIVYLHGFLSSPQSAKAQQMNLHLRKYHSSIDYMVPALPESPQQAHAIAEAVVQAALKENAQVGLIGSSMGGFYATVLAERFRLRAVVINPSVQPQLSIEKYFGEHHNPYTGQQFLIGAADARALQAMAIAQLVHPRNYWLLAQTGDEVLDYRQAVAFYRGSVQTIEPDGDHQFQGFDRYLPDVVKFLQCAAE